MFDYDNDQLGVFEEDYSALLEDDAGFEAEDQLLSELISLYDDDLTHLEELVEKADKDLSKIAEYVEKFLGNVMVVCDDEYNVDGRHYFELMLVEYDLPSMLEFENET